MRENREKYMVLNTNKDGHCNSYQFTSIRDWTIRGLFLVKHLGWINVMERRDYFMGMLMHRCVYMATHQTTSKNFSPSF